MHRHRNVKGWYTAVKLASYGFIDRRAGLRWLVIASIIGVYQDFESDVWLVSLPQLQRNLRIQLTEPLNGTLYKAST